MTPIRWSQIIILFLQDMQVRVDWTTGGLGFYDADPQRRQSKDDFSSNDDINKDFDPIPSRLPIEKRIEIICSVGHQIVGQNLLRKRLLQKQFPRCYDGFQPSGRMHIAQGLLRAVNVNKLVDAGCVFVFWVADYFAMLNGKFNGDLDKIRTVGRYFIEVWKAVGMKMSNVRFLWASQEINRRPNQYWLKVMEISCANSIGRIQKCATIMGKKESDSLKTSQLFYPCMQCADIFFLDVDICQLGIDQRKVNMLAVDMVNNDQEKPIIISHGMISGLLEGQAKMSKSDPRSAIFMEDSAKEVDYKIKGAYCPPKIVEGNPIMDYCQNIIFACKDQLLVCRKPDHGGDKLYRSYNELREDYLTDQLHPEDVKKAVAKVINELIEPVRRHFETDPTAKALIKMVKTYKAEAEAGAQVQKKQGI